MAEEGVHVRRHRTCHLRQVGSCASPQHGDHRRVGDDRPPVVGQVRDRGPIGERPRRCRVTDLRLGRQHAARQTRSWVDRTVSSWLGAATRGHRVRAGRAQIQQPQTHQPQHGRGNDRPPPIRDHRFLLGCWFHRRRGYVAPGCPWPGPARSTVRRGTRRAIGRKSYLTYAIGQLATSRSASAPVWQLIHGALTARAGDPPVTDQVRATSGGRGRRGPIAASSASAACVTRPLRALP